MTSGRCCSENVLGKMYEGEGESCISRFSRLFLPLAHQSCHDGRGVSRGVEQNGESERNRERARARMSATLHLALA